MGLGFKRLVDLSSLSLKQLNDQLEQVWLKVMGGIGQRDLDRPLRDVISSKVSEGELSSLIAQNGDSVRLAVGRSHGENLMRNPCGGLGLLGWTCSGGVATGKDAGGSYFALDGVMTQTGIPVAAGKRYAFGLEYAGSTPVELLVRGQGSGGEWVELERKSLPASGEAAAYQTSYVMPEGVERLSVQLSGEGAKARYFYLHPGDGTIGYTPNPNEIAGSGVLIGEDMVRISTPQFRLELTDPLGQVVSVISADGNGFSDLVCSEITMAGRKMYGKHPGAIYVNPDTGLDTNSGLSKEAAVKTIHRAFALLPLFMEGEATVYLGGHTYYESILFNHGGTGNVTIRGENAILYGSIQVKSYSGNLTVDNLRVYSNDGVGVSCSAGAACLQVENSLIDCNKAAGSIGIHIQNGARGTMMLCEVNNCDRAIVVDRMGIGCFYDCTGTNNGSGILCRQGGFLIGDGLVPMADEVITEYDTGGQLYADVIATEMGSRYTPPGDGVKLFTATATKTATLQGGVWLEDQLTQGAGRSGVKNCGVLFFDGAAIKKALSGKRVRSAELVIKRRESGPNVLPVGVNVWTHGMTGVGQEMNLIANLGRRSTVRMGEEARLPLPLTVAEDFAGGAWGYCLYDASAGAEQYAEFCPLLEFASRLEVRYE